MTARGAFRAALMAQPFVIVVLMSTVGLDAAASVLHSLEFWIGLLTWPTTAALWVGSFFLGSALEHQLDKKFGITIEVHRGRQELPTDYALRHDIWWERSWGPVFAGGWYREVDRPWPSIQAFPADRFATRWVGLGWRTRGSLTIYRKRDLGHREETD